MDKLEAIKSFAKERDEKKRQLCAENGVKLIEIPYWEDTEKYLLTELKKWDEELRPKTEINDKRELLN